MKHIYTLAFALLASFGLNAQVDITFAVDLNGTMASMDGVHLAGNFHDFDEDGTIDNPAISANWQPNLPELMLADPDMDGVYSITLSLVAGDYQFKFINGNNWDAVEDVPPTCRVEVTGNSNRYITVGDEADDYSVCWESCAACGDYAVRFRVDMQLQAAVSPNGVHASGEFNGWAPDSSPLGDPDGDQIWECYYSFPGTALVNDSLIYKYINGNAWENPNEFVMPECGDGSGNRAAVITETNTVLDVYCFDACEACTQPTMVTLRVDMSTQAEVSANGVHVAGSFQGWTAGATPLMDMGAGIWEVTVPLAPGDYQYKFINGNDWGGDGDGNIDNENLVGECSSETNRIITVGEEAMTVQYCYNQCSETCVADPDPANITFSVDMSEVVDAGELSADGVWLIGGFTAPNWQAGALPMTDPDGDNVYEVTWLVEGAADIQYKFTNGDPYPGGTVDASVEENNDFDADGCGVGNGLGGFNRTHTRSGMEETLGVVCYNSCLACDVSIDETLNARIAAFPNPANTTVNLQVPAGAQVLIFDAAGREVFQTNTTQSLTNIDVQDWNTGVYAVQVRLDGQVGQIRFVVK